MNIIGIYKITNTITGDFYIGSSKDVKSRWAVHKCQTTWNKCSNNPMYQDMQKYGVDKFEFEILAEVEPEELKGAEQKFIETLKPTYNNRNANGLDIDKFKDYQKEYHKEYNKSDKYKEYQKEYQEEYRKTDKCKQYQKEYQKEYHNQLCCYNGETLTLNALRTRFMRKGISNPTIEAKKYLLNKSKDKNIDL